MINDYPRMLFDHRNRDVRTVQSRDEEDELGRGWSRKVWSEDDPFPEPETISMAEAIAGEAEPPDETPQYEPPPADDPPGGSPAPPPAKRSHKRKS